MNPNRALLKSAHSITVLTCIVLTVAVTSNAQTASPDISGFWELRSWSRNIPKAALTPAAANADRQAQAEKEFHAIRWCNHVGLPFMMDDGAPIDVRQSKNEIAIASQSNSPVRHIYMDGRQHPSIDTFDRQRWAIRSAAGVEIRWWWTRSASMRPD